MEDILKTLLSYQLPKGLLDYFELVSVEQEEGKLLLQLDELNVKPVGSDWFGVKRLSSSGSLRRLSNT